MSLIIVTGEQFNSIERAVAALVASGAIDANYPLTNISNRIPAQPTRWSAIAANLSLTADLNAVSNGGMETNNAGVPASWTSASTGTGAMTRTVAAGEFNGGAAGMKLAAGGAGTAVGIQDIVVRSGERRNITAALKGDGANASKIRVQNLATGKWLKSDGTWQTSQQDLFTRVAASWAVSGPFNYTVETFSVTLWDQVSLRIYAVNDTNGATTFADDIYDWPDTDLVAVCGHNLRPVVSPEWRHSTDNFSGSDNSIVVMAIARPSFYGTGSSSRRYQRLILNGTAWPAAPYIGELVMTQQRVLVRQQNYGFKWHFEEPMVANRTVGINRVYLLADEQARTITMEFTYPGASLFNEARDEVFRRGRGGAKGMLLIPDSSGPAVIYGRAPSQFEAAQALVGLYDHATITVEEMPLPAFVG